MDGSSLIEVRDKRHRPGIGAPSWGEWFLP
jgi:hypothetical protein